MSARELLGRAESTGPAPVSAGSRRLPRPDAPVLTWPGKSAIPDRDLVHAADGTPVGDFELVASVRDADDENLVVVGDNASVMRRLLARDHSLAGQVRLCYLDPPYNTGESFSTYRDSRPVGEWLSAIAERLTLVRSLLRPDGSVWLHLDDNHQHHGRMVLDEVFGAHAFVATVVWQKRTTRDSRRAFSQSHDYIHVYSPAGPKAWKKVRNGLPDNGEFKNPDSDPRGPWRSVPLTAQAGHATRSQFYVVTTPTGHQHGPPSGRCWSYTAERLSQLDQEGRVYWPRGGAGRPRLKRYQSESSALAPFTIWDRSFAGDTSSAKKELLTLFPGESRFDTPKPERLLERILQIGTDPDDLVLDPYFGSGTTGVVAAQMNRRFIGVEVSADVVHRIALPRIEKMRKAPRYSVLREPASG